MVYSTGSVGTLDRSTDDYMLIASTIIRAHNKRLKIIQFLGQCITKPVDQFPFYMVIFRRQYFNYCYCYYYSHQFSMPQPLLYIDSLRRITLLVFSFARKKAWAISHLVGQKFNRFIDWLITSKYRDRGSANTRNHVDDGYCCHHIRKQRSVTQKKPGLFLMCFRFGGGEKRRID
ncbi:hypothetical protein BDC45DRAFT_535574 [Circinella umbellata]|nr:hypothetical protein BDC45DRAFT_535574 [Circinella umbellata]